MTVDKTDIPKTQKAAIFDEFGKPVRIADIPTNADKLGPDDILVKVRFSGVCHTDLHVWQGDFPIPAKDFPIVGGHEGAGEVVAIGSNVQTFAVGDLAGIQWINSACLACEMCRQGFEPNCDHVLLSGFTRDGSFQQYAVVSAAEAAHIPKGTDLTKVAPILCAGVTVYKALKESGLRSGQIVAISGAGGGLGTLCIQYAKAMGIRPMALDSADKEKHCRKMGAEFFVDSFAKDVHERVRAETAGLGPHAVICIAPAEKALNDAVVFVRQRGTVVLVALPRDVSLKVPVFDAVVRCIQIKGSYVGNRQDTAEAVDFFSRGLVDIPIKVEPLSKLPEIYEQMRESKISGRIVVDLWK